jgi:hypothetical protein
MGDKHGASGGHVQVNVIEITAVGSLPVLVLLLVLDLPSDFFEDEDDDENDISSPI